MTGQSERDPARLDDSQEVTDETLLHQAADGQHEAVAGLYDRYQGVAYALALRITGEASLAQDVLQDAFLGAWRNAGRYAPERGSVRTWLLAIVHHRAVDAVRRRKPTTELPDESAPPSRMVLPDIWPEVARNLDRDAVLAALTTLPPAQREAIELAYFGGLTQTEIATRTGAPLGTVKSRVRMGLLTLRDALGAAWAPEGSAAHASSQDARERAAASRSGDGQGRAVAEHAVSDAEATP